MVCLIKPQFEAGKEKVGKKGVVRDPAVHEEVVHRIMDFTKIAGFEVMHLDFSPIKGPEGNIEYLIHIRKDPSMNDKVSELTEAEGEKILRTVEEEKSGISHEPEMEKLISDTVGRAHGNLDK
jgi:23S rRNA (cytidine1920-2'-O)/16S rRNA (cytidine1409-2'-O)-methyltransferase